MGIIRSIFLIIIVSILIILILPIQLLINLINLKIKYKIPKLFLKIVSFVIGIKIRSINLRNKNKNKYGVLYVSNHVSWMDILCLGSLLDAQFIAKKEVAEMGLFGFLAKLNHTFFIDNTNQRKSFSYNEIIQAKLLKKQNLILFPEGTTSDGNSVRSFKSSFFDSTNLPKYYPEKENDFIDVCPISLCYKDKNNLPMGIFYRRYVAWQGDYPLLRLMKIFLLSGPVSIDIIIHKSVDLSNFKNRKELSNYCQNTIQNAITKELMV
jgi:1-acyl-sn-glycerol-3-phosphate acyltransferase